MNKLILIFIAILFVSTVFSRSANAQQVVPYFDCNEPIYSNGTLVYIKSYFGYYNPSASNIVIQRGPNNFMLPPNNADQLPTTFLPGYHDKAFSTIGTYPNGKTWFLGTLRATMTVATATLCGTEAMTYQGRLSASGATANGSYDMQFKFYDLPVGGAAHPKVLNIAGVAVTNGVFSVPLNVGHIFDDTLQSGFLEIGIRQAGDTSPYTILDPRQPITSVPFAYRAQRAINADNATNAINATNATNAANATNATNAVNATNIAGGTIKIQQIQGTPSSTDVNGGCYFNGSTNVSDAEVGTMRFDVINNRLFICTRIGWKFSALQ